MLLTLLQSSGGTPGNYVLTCQGGAYTIAGQQATLLRTKRIVANGGAYTFTGQQVTITYTAGTTNYTLTAFGGAYNLTGQNVTLLKSRRLTCQGGVYNIAGQNATLSVSGGEQETRGGIDPRYIRWWLNKHKKTPVETVEEALEIVEETISETPPQQQPKAVKLARQDKTLQLFIARQILLAQIETARLERLIEEDEEEAILALLL